MTDKAHAQLIKRLAKIEKEIQNSEVEVGVRERRLSELRTKCKTVEAQSKQEFGCSMKELPDHVKQGEAELERLVSELEADLAAAKGDEDED